MNLSSTSIKVVATTSVPLADPGVTGIASIGMNLTTRFEDSDIAWGAALDFGATGHVVTTDLGNGLLSTSVAAPVAQVETATAAGTITLAGNATATLTSARIPGSPLAVPVAVAEFDTPPVWAGKVREALAATAAITAHYAVSGNSTTIRLTSLWKGGNDVSLNLALADATSAGITEAATSASTTPGVAGVVITGGDGKDLEGNPLPVAASLQTLVLQNTGAYGVSLSSAMYIAPGSFLALGGPVLYGALLDEEALVLTSEGPTTLLVFVFAKS